MSCYFQVRIYLTLATSKGIFCITNVTENREQSLSGEVRESKSSDEFIVKEIRSIRSQIHDEGRVIEELVDGEILKVKPVSKPQEPPALTIVRNIISDPVALDYSDSQSGNLYVDERSRRKKALKLTA